MFQKVRQTFREKRCTKTRSSSCTITYSCIGQILLLRMLILIVIIAWVANLSNHLGSISPMFYEQLLRTQIPKVQKKTDNLPVFFALSGSVWVKAAFRTSMKLTTGLNFINILHTAFTCVDSESVGFSQILSIFLRFWDLHAQKLLVKRWWNRHLITELW